jgi:hypothetical protein
MGGVLLVILGIAGSRELMVIGKVPPDLYWGPSIPSGRSA